MYLFFLFIVDLQILLEPLLSLLPLGIILLEILAKIDEMDLYLQIPLSNVFLLGLEVLLVSGYEDGLTS